MKTYLIQRKRTITPKIYYGWRSICTPCNHHKILIEFLNGDRFITNDFRLMISAHFFKTISIININGCYLTNSNIVLKIKQLILFYQQMLSESFF